MEDNINHKILDMGLPVDATFLINGKCNLKEAILYAGTSKSSPSNPRQSHQRESAEQTLIFVRCLLLGLFNFLNIISIFIITI